MKRMVCEACGGNDFIKKDEFFVCQHCGVKYSLEEAKKMIIEGTVKVDNSEEINNLYMLARRARDNNDSEKAGNYYDKILLKEPNDWEANFYSTYYNAKMCKIGEIGFAATKIINCESSVFNLIKENITDLSKQREDLEEVAVKLVTISVMLFNSYKKFYDEIDGDIKGGYTQEYADNCSAARDILYNAGDLIMETFGEACQDIASICWKEGVRLHKILIPVFKNKPLNHSIIQDYQNKAMKGNSQFKEKTEKERQQYNEGFNKDVKLVKTCYVIKRWVSIVGILSFIFMVIGLGAESEGLFVFGFGFGFIILYLSCCVNIVIGIICCVKQGKGRLFFLSILLSISMIGAILISIIQLNGGSYVKAIELRYKENGKWFIDDNV